MGQRNYFRETIRNYELGEIKEITAPDYRTLLIRIQEQEDRWKRRLERKRAAESKAAEREKKQKEEEEALRSAIERATQAERVQNALDNILVEAVEKKEAFLFPQQRRQPFPEEKPAYPPMEELPREPQETDPEYQVKLGFLANLSKKRKDAASHQAHEAFDKQHQRWVESCNEVKRTNDARIADYNAELAQWRSREASYRREQLEYNNRVEDEIKRFNAREPEVVAQVIARAVNQISLPIDHEFNAVASYMPDENALVMDLFLPRVEDIPTLKTVSYMKTKHEQKEQHYSEAQRKRKHESVTYQIVLRVLKRIFSAGYDPYPVNTVILNGRMNTFDKTTGNPITPCVLSLSVSREEFSALNLKQVDPKAWFKSSHGVSAASIADVTPIAPIATINTNDARFIDSYPVEDSLSEGDNLAAMDWQDFEQLIRELFEKEFSSNGGEVRITQASRDGGVDAVAFDPDPIRGGKIVIQAKRYTNTVGVSAVRDLYGTVINEGAMKGILITTANYGNDAYEFARDKPITLMNGANLLALLEKHGHAARINLAEAREQLKKEGNQ